MKEKFFEYFDYLIKNCKEPIEMPKEVARYLEVLRASSSAIEKPIITENGIMILEYLQGEASKSEDKKGYKAKDIAEALFVSSRTVSGSIRKLVTDGFVERIGADPAVYVITEKGISFDIEGVRK